MVGFLFLANEACIFGIYCLFLWRQRREKERKKERMKEITGGSPIRMFRWIKVIVAQTYKGKKKTPLEFLCLMDL